MEMKILIADFSADARRLFAENMKRFGAAEVLEAANGEDAVILFGKAPVFQYHHTGGDLFASEIGNIKGFNVLGDNL